MTILFHFNGQAAYEVDTGRLKKIRVVFGMIDNPRTSMAWYLFASHGVAKSKYERAHRDPMPPEEFGDRGVGGRDIPHTFHKDIDLEGLAIHPKGTSATLTLGDSGNFIDCRIDHLMTKAREIVTFPFGLQTDTTLLPSRAGTFHGNVLFLETAPFDRNQFPLGPQGKEKTLITGRSL